MRDTGWAIFVSGSRKSWGPCPEEGLVSTSGPEINGIPQSYPSTSESSVAPLHCLLATEVRFFGNRGSTQEAMACNHNYPQIPSGPVLYPQPPLFPKHSPREVACFPPSSTPFPVKPGYRRCEASKGRCCFSGPWSCDQYCYIKLRCLGPKVAKKSKKRGNQRRKRKRA